jgi:hypothetical protein
MRKNEYESCKMMLRIYGVKEEKYQHAEATRQMGGPMLEIDKTKKSAKARPINDNLNIRIRVINLTID